MTLSFLPYAMIYELHVYCVLWCWSALEQNLGHDSTFLCFFPSQVPSPNHSLCLTSPLPGWPMKEAMPVLTAGAGESETHTHTHTLSPHCHLPTCLWLTHPSHPPQGYMRRWPCWPLSCGPTPITRRTWSSSETSSARGAWDTWWRSDCPRGLTYVRCSGALSCAEYSQWLVAHVTKSKQVAH